MRELTFNEVEEVNGGVSGREWWGLGAGLIGGVLVRHPAGGLLGYQIGLELYDLAWN